MTEDQIPFDLADIPAGAVARGVTAKPDMIDGRPALRLALDEPTRAGEPGIDFVDRPTFLILPVTAAAGRIAVSIRSGLLPDAPDYARGFAGVAFRVTDTHFESVYLRPTNGSSVTPEGPRRERAVQYFAYPDWPFDRLREERPHGGFEAAADIRPDTWARLVVDFSAEGIRASIDDVPVLTLDEPLGDGSPGAVALWVDIGTDAWFRDLEIRVDA